MKRLWIAAVVCLIGGTAGAHPLDLGYLRVDADDATIAVELKVEATVAASLAGVSDPAQIGGRARELADATILMAPIKRGGASCEWLATVEAELVAPLVRVAGRARCGNTQDGVSWPLPFMAKLLPTFQLLVKLRIGGDERALIVERTKPALEIGDSDELGFTDFLISGIDHIGARPNQWRDDGGDFKLPDGIDHILFLLALLLGGGTLLQLLGIATGFTIGHSVTLALAALDVVRIPPTIIEPLVALTIALAALETFTGDKLHNHRWKIAGGFGLIHGFAFAFALTELELTTAGKVKALFGFNFGVEIGQVIIVLIAAPLIMLIHRKPTVRAIVVPTVAGAIFVAGVYWFLVRL